MPFFSDGLMPQRRADFSKLVRRGFLPFVLFGLLLSARPLRAQDVMVGEALWALPGAAPDEMPKASRIHPNYPKELRTTGEVGYVIVYRYVGATGESRGLHATGTQLPFQRAVEAAAGNWAMKAATGC